MKNNEWKKVCAACAEGTPPERCAYYGDPNGCNAPTLGKHPEGDLAERLQEALEKAERRIAELERASGNAAAMREALEDVLQFDATDEAAEEDGLTDAERIAEYADHIEECQKKARAALAAPARNCDVGTTEEQAERFVEFCKDHLCDTCPVRTAKRCGVGWSQTPFVPVKEGGDHA